MSNPHLTTPATPQLTLVTLHEATLSHLTILNDFCLKALLINNLFSIVARSVPIECAPLSYPYLKL